MRRASLSCQRSILELGPIKAGTGVKKGRVIIIWTSLRPWRQVRRKYILAAENKSILAPWLKALGSAARTADLPTIGSPTLAIWGAPKSDAILSLVLLEGRAGNPL